jgi:hypothetical protein
MSTDGLNQEKMARLQKRTEELRGAGQFSVWEPEVIAHAFARTQHQFVLTMQGWIDLSAVKSPILIEEHCETVEEINAALAAFGWPVRATSMEPEEELACEELMIAAVRRGFAAALPMSEPGATGSPGERKFGTWITVLAALVKRLGMGLAEAMQMPVEQAYMLVAAERWNEGWETSGVPYSLRGGSSTLSSASRDGTDRTDRTDRTEGGLNG